MRSFTFENTWSALSNVLIALIPLLVFAVSLAIAVYCLFVLIVPRLNGVSVDSIGNGAEGGSDEANGGANSADAGIPEVRKKEIGVDGMTGVSYVLMTALFGIIIGMLANQIGGLEALLEKPSEDSLQKGLLSTVGSRWA